MRIACALGSTLTPRVGKSVYPGSTLIELQQRMNARTFIMWKLVLRLASLLSVCIFATASLSQAAKTDLLILDNGNNIVGEVTTLQRGKLTFKTDNIGTLSVEWPHVSELRSTNRFLIETEHGRKFSGSLAKASAGQLSVESDGVVVATLEISGVVNMYRVEHTFLSRIDSSLDVGYSYTQQNADTQFNINAALRERTEKRQLTINFSTLFSTQEDADETRRSDLTGVFYKRFERKWFYLGLASAEQNNGLDLDLRTVFGGGIGHELYHTNSTIFALFTGLNYNRELYAFNDESVNSLEASGGVEFSYFTFDGMTSEITTRLLLAPSLTDAGRFRLKVDTDFRQKIIGDLYWSLNLYELFDSRPPQPDAPRNDFGITTSVGWSF